MRILITGCAGYIGSTLCKKLSEPWYDIIGVDNLLYNQGHIVHPAFKDIKFHRMDVDDIPDECDFDVCFPLHCLVGMPICEKNPDLAQRTNLDSLKRLLQKLPEECLVIYPSTNSGYGHVQGLCTEETPLKSVSLYGKLKEEAEKVVLSRKKSIVFRLATVFGKSFRTRLDLLVNTLIYDWYFERNVRVFDDSFMRNYVHIFDVVAGFEFAIDNYAQMIGNVYNLGNDSLNMTKMDLAQKICDKSNVKITKINATDPDTRNYTVSSQKLYSLGYKPLFDINWGINELVDYFQYLPQNKLAREKITECMRNDLLVSKD